MGVEFNWVERWVALSCDLRWAELRRELIRVELCWIVGWVVFSCKLNWVQLWVEMMGWAQLNGVWNWVQLGWALSCVEMWFALSCIASWVDLSWVVLSSSLSWVQLWVELSSIVSWVDGMSSAHLSRVQLCSVEFNCELSSVQVRVELMEWAQLNGAGSRVQFR